MTVRATPRAKRSEAKGVRNGALQVRTTAPPTDGKANKAVIDLLAKLLGVAPSRISLLRGHARRDKQFLVKDGANGL